MKLYRVIEYIVNEQMDWQKKNDEFNLLIKIAILNGYKKDTILKDTSGQNK